MFGNGPKLCASAVRAVVNYMSGRCGTKSKPESRSSDKRLARSARCFECALFKLSEYLKPDAIGAAFWTTTNPVRSCRVEGIPEALRPFFAARRRSTSSRKLRLIIVRFCKGAYLHLALSKPSFVHAHQGDYQEMKTIVLASFAAGGSPSCFASPAAAENANGNADTGSQCGQQLTQRRTSIPSAPSARSTPTMSALIRRGFPLGRKH